MLELLGLAAGAALGFLVANASYGFRASMRSWAVGDVSERTVINLFIWLNGAGLVLYGLFVQGPIFDRYVWSVAFAAAILLAAKALGTPANAPFLAGAAPRRHRPPRRHRRPRPTPDDTALHPRPDDRCVCPFAWRSPAIATVAATVVLAIIAGAVAASLTLNADAYDGARWSAGQAAVHAGARPGTVDAGFDWVGSHAATPAVRARQVTGLPSYETWYNQLFPKFRDCAFVSGSLPAPHGTSLVGRMRYQEVGFAVPEYLYVYAVALLPTLVPVSYLAAFCWQTWIWASKGPVRAVTGIVLRRLPGQRLRLPPGRPWRWWSGPPTSRGRPRLRTPGRAPRAASLGWPWP